MKRKLTAFERIIVSSIVSVLVFICFLFLIKIHGNLRAVEVTKYDYIGYVVYCLPGWILLGIFLNEVSFFSTKNVLRLIFGYWKSIALIVTALLLVSFFTNLSISKTFGSYMALLFFASLTLTHQISKRDYKI